jgi:hypothetical protein
MYFFARGEGVGGDAHVTHQPGAVRTVQIGPVIRRWLAGDKMRLVWEAQETVLHEWFHVYQRSFSAAAMEHWADVFARRVMRRLYSPSRRPLTKLARWSFGENYGKPPREIVTPMPSEPAQ